MALSPREDILADIISKVWTVDDIKFVSRNLRLVAGLRDFPAVFVVDLGDSVHHTGARPQPAYQRLWKIGTLAIIKGTTEESAPGELDTFVDALRAAIYDDKTTVGTSAKSRILETNRSQVVFPATAPAVVAQSVEWQIAYIDDTSTL